MTLAAQELRWLLERGYPRESCLTLVGNRRGLAARERELLRRGVLAPALARARRAKLLSPAQLAGERLGIDGHNVLITLESALAGRDLIRGDDGVVRDISRGGSSHRPTDLTQRALEVILPALSRSGVKEAVFYLDRPISRSGELAALIREKLEAAGLPGTARAVPVPDRELKPFAGIAASSDGELIDHCPRPLDLAGWLIRERLKGTRIIEFTR